MYLFDGGQGFAYSNFSLIDTTLTTCRRGYMLRFDRRDICMYPFCRIINESDTYRMEPGLAIRPFREAM